MILDYGSQIFHWRRELKMKIRKATISAVVQEVEKVISKYPL